MFTLYYAPHTCALATHIALRDAAASYELKRINFGETEQQSAAYLTVNPKGRVPAMVTPRGILTETPAMLAFIAQSFPQARLAPLDDPFAFAELQAFNSYLCSTLHVAHAHRMRGYRWADEAASFADMLRKVPKSVAACYDLIETHMLKGPWVMGDAYTIADPYLFTFAQWLEDDGVSPARFPRVVDHRSRMSQRPNVRMAIAGGVCVASAATVYARATAVQNLGLADIAARRTQRVKVVARMGGNHEQSKHGAHPSLRGGGHRCRPYLRLRHVHGNPLRHRFVSATGAGRRRQAAPCSAAR